LNIKFIEKEVTMAENHELIIRNAVLRSGEKVDIAISDSKIAAIAPRLDVKAATEIDAAGNLVTESFVNTHLHCARCTP